MSATSNDRIIRFNVTWGKCLVMKILPKLINIFKSAKVTKSSKPVLQKVEKTVAEPISLNKVTENVSSQTKKEKNPFLEYIYNEYEKDGVSRDVVDRVVLGGERLRYYRYVGKEELQKLLSGEKITSTRPCYGGKFTDVTSDPNYGLIPTMGKYRLTFKDKKEFAPYPLGEDANSRIIEHKLGNSEFYLRGGYTIDDIEKIEQKVGKNTFKLLDLLG